VFKLVIAASRSRRRVTGKNQLPNVTGGVTFSKALKRRQTMPPDRRHQNPASFWYHDIATSCRAAHDRIPGKRRRTLSIFAQPFGVDFR
jgi:hypothetical protein